MGRSRRLAGLAGLLLVAGLGFIGLEYQRGRRGPTPAPTKASMAAGRKWLARMLTATGARWTTSEPVSFVVTPSRFGRSTVALDLEFDPVSRILRVGPGPGRPEVLVFDPSDGSVRPDGGSAMRTLLPSIDFWTIAPAAFDDATLILWRLPDAKGRARVAARWPKEADWFILESVPGSDRLESVEFVDARFGLFLRWRGFYDGPLAGDGEPIPAAWRFRAASPLLDFLLGHREPVAFHFRRS
ncbi:MAG: hypothetical protein FD129_873 [bacterium]|nr:MAG: hypothetical protein FD129_873 [bacterium]